MPGQIPVGQIHHMRLTVTDIQRSRQFYPSLLGFQVAVESPPPGDPSEAETFRVLFAGVVMIRGNLMMGLRPMAPEGDRFDPDRVGLDHLSFGVAGLGQASARAARQQRPSPKSGEAVRESRQGRYCAGGCQLRLVAGLDAVPVETFTFLFTHVEGSTAVLGRVGQGVYERVLADHHQIIRSRR